MTMYRVDSVSRAIDILVAISENQPVGLSELARITGLTKATVYRLAVSLEQRSLLRQESKSKRYLLGNGLVGLGQRAIEGRDFLEDAKREIEPLCGIYSVVFTVNLLSDDCVVEAARLPYDRQGRFAPLGTRIPCVASVSGLVFMAHNAELAARILAKEVPRYASGTPTDGEAFFKIRRSILDSGYASLADTMEEGVTGVSAPVLDFNGDAEYTISAVGPTGAMTKFEWTALATDLVDASRKLNAP